MRIDPLTQLIVLADSNPENIVVAPVGSYLSRNGDVFSLIKLNSSGERIEVSKKALAYRYASETWWPNVQDFRLTYEHDYEIWYKDSGTGNTGWKFISFDKKFSVG
jgi:hypothetical protein